MVNDMTGVPNACELILGFFQKNYIYTTLINVTRNECHIIHYDENYVPEFPKMTTFDHMLTNVDKFVHPMFIQEFKDNFAREELIKASAENRDIEFEFLHFIYGDNRYHWVTAKITHIKNSTGDVVFIYTAVCTDEENAEREKNKEVIFNRAVIDLLINNYLLVHIVDLGNSMSRLVHSREGDFYDNYAARFDTHLEMMKHLYDNYIDADFKKDFEKFIEYDYVFKQFAAGKERLIHVFRDNRNLTFELTVLKCPSYSEDYPLVVYAIKEIV